MLVAHELSLLMTILNLDQWISVVFSFFTLSCSILPYILSFLLFTIHSIIFTVRSIILTICSIIFAIFTGLQLLHPVMLQSLERDVLH